MRRIVFGLVLTIVLFPFFFWCLLWLPVNVSLLDPLTRHTPMWVRETVSKEMLTHVHFRQADMTTASRAVLLTPNSEEAWSVLCSVQALGSDVQRTLQTCKRAESLVQTGGFNAELVADAYARSGRPCESLSLVKKRAAADKVNNGLKSQLGVLELNCGDRKGAETHFREAISQSLEDYKFWHTEDRPPLTGEPTDSYERSNRVELSEDRMNLSALLSLNGEREEAFQLCRAATGRKAERCTCWFTGQSIIHLAQCDAVPKE